MRTDFEEEDIAATEEYKFDPVFSVDRESPYIFLFAMEFVVLKARMERVCFK